MEYLFKIKSLDESENVAYLEDENGFIVKWPLSKTSGNLKEGGEIYFSISDKKQKKAKEILNEILKLDE